MADFKNAAMIMKKYFLARGYKENMINDKIEEVAAMNREDILQYKTKNIGDKKQRIPLVITYHPRLRSMGKILAKHFPLLQGNERLKMAFPEPPMAAFRKLRNIKSILGTKLDFETGKMRSKKCESTMGCKCCNHIQEESNFLINGRPHTTKFGGGCGSKNLIYAMECIKCSKWYIGETGDTLRGRLNGHRSLTKKVLGGGTLDENSNDCGAPLHFGQKDHCFEKDMKIYILEQGKWGDMKERRIKESYYIAKYQTLAPHGMNKHAGPLSDLYEFL